MFICWFIIELVYLILQTTFLKKKTNSFYYKINNSIISKHINMIINNVLSDLTLINKVSNLSLVNKKNQC